MARVPRRLCTYSYADSRRLNYRICESVDGWAGLRSQRRVESFEQAVADIDLRPRAELSKFGPWKIGGWTV